MISRHEWNKLQLEAMPHYRKCPSCDETTACDEDEVDSRSFGMEHELENGEWWYIPQYKCILCGFAFDGEHNHYSTIPPVKKEEP